MMGKGWRGQGQVAFGSSQETAFEQLLASQIRQNGRLFFRLAHGVLRDVTAAEDICQHAMMKACERRHELRDAASLRSWLARVVVNEALQLLRRRKTEARILADSGVMAPASNPSEPTGFELREAVLAAVEDLPESERAVILLRVMEGHSGRDVGKLLGCSDSEISRRLHRGMEKLRQVLVDWKTA